jgi:TetR/AcrR family transcriptional regulator, fatty acid metabolism regulator protein
MRSTPERDGTFTERARRGQIVECAIELIAERGYGDTSIAKIAERAGIAKSVVLYHFVSKEELVGAVVIQVSGVAATALVPAIEAEATAGGKLRAYIRASGEYIETHRSYARALLDIGTSYRTASGGRLGEASAPGELDGDLATLDPGPIFELGQRNREFRSFDPMTMAVALRQSIDGAVLLLSRDPEFNIARYCEELVTLFDRATRRDP